VRAAFSLGAFRFAGEAVRMKLRRPTACLLGTQRRAPPPRDTVCVTMQWRAPSVGGTQKPEPSRESKSVGQTMTREETHSQSGGGCIRILHCIPLEPPADPAGTGGEGRGCPQCMSGGLVERAARRTKSEHSACTPPLPRHLYQYLSPPDLKRDPGNLTWRQAGRDASCPQAPQLPAEEARASPPFPVSPRCTIHTSSTTNLNKMALAQKASCSARVASRAVAVARPSLRRAVTVRAAAQSNKVCVMREFRRR
jgi:hypothetical protein